MAVALASIKSVLAGEASDVLNRVIERRPRTGMDTLDNSSLGEPQAQ
jgi:hypothetical protein